MKNLFAAIVLAAMLPFAAHAVTASPTTALWVSDITGATADVLPAEFFTNQRVVGVSGYVSMTCPAGTTHIGMSTHGNADYSWKPNANSCPTGDIDDGTACNDRPTVRGWTLTPAPINWLLFQAAQNTIIHLSCYKWQTQPNNP